MALPAGISKDSIRAVFEMLDQLVSGSDGSAPVSLQVKAASYVPKGDQQITIATLQAKQALTVPSGAVVAIIQNNTTQALRWRDGPAGTDPTTTVGQRIPAGETLTYDGTLSQFEIIAEAAGTGTLDIWYGA